MPGPQLTVDNTLSPPDVVASKVDAVICCKLFRVLSVHVEEAAVQLDPVDVELARAACAHFGLPPETF